MLQSGESPIVLVVSPTRELALQIQVEFEKLLVHTKLRVCCIYGGFDRGQQVAAVRQGAEVFIATVGRLMDLLQDQVINMQRVTYFVLDEVCPSTCASAVPHPLPSPVHPASGLSLRTMFF